MSKTGSKHRPAFKVKVDLEAVKREETVARLAARYLIHLQKGGAKVSQEGDRSLTHGG